MNLIKYVTMELGIRQKDLAEHLGVSAAQISKWKKGESIPYEREGAIFKFAGIKTENLELVLAIGNDEKAQEWIEFIADLNSQSDFKSDFMMDMPELYASYLLLALCKLGVKLPEVVPVQVKDEDGYDTYTNPNFTEALESIIENYGMYETWICSELGGISSETEDTNLAQELDRLEGHMQSSMDYLSIYHIDDNYFTHLGLNQDVVVSAVQKNVSAVNSEIHSFYQYLEANGKKISSDYFDFVSKPPIELYEHVTMSSPLGGIENYYSQGEQEILQNQKLIMGMLSNLTGELNKIKETLA